MSKNNKRIGVDLGGSKIEIIVLDESNAELYRERVATPRHNYQATIDVVCELVATAERKTGLAGSVGIAMPGALSQGVIKNANSVWLNGKPLQTDFEQALDRPVRLANDANCFTLSEAIDGAAHNASSVFGVIIGTGTGGGIVINKSIINGCNDIAGEWGHNPLPWSGPADEPEMVCYCGKQGCIETYLSGPGLAQYYQLLTEDNVSAEIIAKRAEQGEVSARQCLHQYQVRLAKALASVINVLDPDVIVLGGGMSNLQSLYTEVPKLWGDYVFSNRVTTRLLKAKHGDSSGVRGAAWLWPLG